MTIYVTLLAPLVFVAGLLFVAGGPAAPGSIVESVCTAASKYAAVLCRITADVFDSAQTCECRSVAGLWLLALYTAPIPTAAISTVATLFLLRHDGTRAVAHFWNHVARLSRTRRTLAYMGLPLLCAFAYWVLSSMEAEAKYASMELSPRAIAYFALVQMVFIFIPITIGMVGLLLFGSRRHPNETEA